MMRRPHSLLAALALLTAPGVALAQADAPDQTQKTAKKPTDSKSAAEPAPRGVYVHDLLEAVPPTGAAITKLDVDNRLGDVRIVGHDGRGLSIFAVKHAPNASTLERLEVKLVQDPSGPVSIRTQLAPSREARAIAAGSARIDLVVRVPRDASVSASVWNGKLRIKGLDNGARADSNQGAIRLETISGVVVAASATGSQSFHEIYGDLQARLLEGHVDVDLVRGDRMSASVKTGSVVARRVKVRKMVVRVIKGDIQVNAELVPGGRYVIAARDGDVTVRVSGKRVRTEVKARADGGELSLPERLVPPSGDASDVVGYLGSGRSLAHLELRSRTGNIILAQF